MWNKWDLLDREQAEELESLVENSEDVVLVSAMTGDGVEDLLAQMGEMLTAKASVQEFLVPASDGRRIAWLHAHGEVLVEEDAKEGPEAPMRRFVVRLNPKELGQFETL